MFAIDTVEKTDTSVVVLLAPKTQVPPPEFDPAELLQFVTLHEIRPGLTGGLIITSVRNQIVISLDPSKIQFQDLSSSVPASDDFVERTSRIVNYLLDRLSADLKAIGLNFTVAVDSSVPDLQAKALLPLVNDKILRDSDAEGLGASTRLWFKSKGVRYELRIEPLGNDLNAAKFFAYVNSHFDAEPLALSEDWLARSLREQFDEFLGFLNRINTAIDEAQS